MKKHIFSLLVLFLVAPMIWAASVEPSVILSEYYASVNNKSGDAIRSALYSKINAHTTVSYDNLKYLFQWTDTYDNAGVTIDDIYSFCDPAYTTTWCSGTCGYNREHSVPKSWFNEATPLYSDAFHLYPTNCYVNSYRGNEPFGECENGTKCTTNGVQAKGRKGTSTFSDGGTSYASVGTVYEPDDEFKGDLARTYFYMVTCYMNNRFNYADGGIDMFKWENSKADLSDYSIALLLKWHRQDPVSKRELVRNEVIYGNKTYNKCDYKQGNRNPFIDYPELAEYIWGNKKGQTVDVSALISGYSDDTIPVDPPTPVTTTKYGVTWSINGTIDHTDSVAENQKPTQMPATPASCSAESNTFIGWTTAAIADSTDEHPIPCITALADFPAVTADITYYAVFAKAETGAAIPATYIFDAQNQEGWSCNAENKGQYWLLDQGKTIESPAIDLMYLSSITVNMRTYGGTSYDQLQVAEETGVLTTMQATSGSTMKEYSWTNNLYVAGTSKLIFSCSNSANNKGIGVKSIVINAAGAGTTFSRYITSCLEPTPSDPTDIDQMVNGKSSNRKFIHRGHLFIEVDGRIYTITGQKIK